MCTDYDNDQGDADDKVFCKNYSSTVTNDYRQNINFPRGSNVRSIKYAYTDGFVVEDSTNNIYVIFRGHRSITDNFKETYMRLMPFKCEDKSSEDSCVNTSIKMAFDSKKDIFLYNVNWS